MSSTTTHNDTGDKSPSRAASTAQSLDWKHAKDLKNGDVVTIRCVGELVETVTRRENHVYIETSYTRETGASAYDLDKMQLVPIGPAPKHPLESHGDCSNCDQSFPKGGPAGVADMSLADAMHFATATLANQDDRESPVDLREALEILINAVTSEVPAPGSEHDDIEQLNPLALDLQKACRELSDTFEGDSNDAEHDAAVTLLNLLRMNNVSLLVDAVYGIYGEMSGKEWDAETMQAVAQHLEGAGLKLAEYQPKGGK